MYVPVEPFEEYSIVVSHSFYGLLFLSCYHLFPSPGFFPMSVIIHVSVKSSKNTLCFN